MINENMYSFYEYVLSNPRYNDDQSIINIIKSDKDKPDFFNLCRAFVDLALFAKRIKDQDNNICAYYSDEDVILVKEAFVKFAENNGIEDRKSLLDMVKDRYKNAITIEELNKNSGVIKNENLDYSAQVGHCGVYYNFTEITIWEKIEPILLGNV